MNLKRKTQREVITPSVKGFLPSNPSYRFTVSSLLKEIKMQEGEWT